MYSFLSTNPVATQQLVARDVNACAQLNAGEIIISKTTFIVTITVCIFLTSLSLLGLAAMSYRQWARNQQNQKAKSFGRKSRYLHRISMMRKEVDDSFSRQYSGCLHHESENPYLVPRSPVELMQVERLLEAPAIPARAARDDSKIGTTRRSLFFDHASALWLPKL